VSEEIQEGDQKTADDGGGNVVSGQRFDEAAKLVAGEQDNSRKCDRMDKVEFEQNLLLAAGPASIKTLGIIS
jgi:hypothetical protein